MTDMTNSATYHQRLDGDLR